MGMHIAKAGRQYQTLRIDRLCRVTHCDADFRDTPLTDREFAQKRWRATAINDVGVDDLHIIHEPVDLRCILNIHCTGARSLIVSAMMPEPATTGAIPAGSRARSRGYFGIVSNLFKQIVYRCHTT